MTSEPGVLARYQALIDDGTLAPDPAQHAVAARLDDLAARLEGYKPAARRGGLVRSLEAVCAAAHRPLYPRRCRPRQIATDGFVFRNGRGDA